MRLNCQVRFGGCDLHTTRFSGAGCRPICRFLLLLLLLCCLSLFFPASFRTLKESKVRGGIRCREVCDGAGGVWRGVRRAFHSRCALLNIILLYKYINIYISPPSPQNVTGGPLYPFRIFCSAFFSFFLSSPSNS